MKRISILEHAQHRAIRIIGRFHAIDRVMRSGVLDQFQELIPSDVLERYHLPEIRSALSYMHEPENLRHSEAARKRFSFEEIFAIQLARALERAQQEIFTGNLYLNRGCTGAVVERHPFGGFKMSGGGTKAGGREYLENFLFPRLVAENVMRRGFTPPEEN